MRELMSEFKELRLHGMAGAWEELSANGGAGIDTSRWLIEHLLQAEHTDRVMCVLSPRLPTLTIVADHSYQNRCPGRAN